MYYWRFGRDDEWWRMDSKISGAMRECDESVVGKCGEFRFGNKLFILYSGAPFVYSVRTHPESGILFRRVVFSENYWHEIRVCESMPKAIGQIHLNNNRKRKIEN